MPSQKKLAPASPTAESVVSAIAACPSCGRLAGDFDQCGSVVLCPMKNGQEPTPLGPQDAIVSCSVEGCHFGRRCVSAKSVMRDIRVGDAGCDRSVELCGATFESLTTATDGASSDGQAASEA